MAASDLLLKDQSSTPAPFAPESTDQGTNAAGTTIKRTMYGAKDGALATLGSTTDAPWDGAAASPTEMAILKAFAAVILGVGGKAVPVSGTVTVAPQRAESLWTDDTSAYFVRVDLGGTITWADLSGNAASAPGVGARPAAGATVLLSRSSFQATAGATGYSNGDYLDHFVTTDPASGAVLGNFWVNLSTGAKLAAAPASGNISPAAPLPTGAATDAKSEAIRALLAGTLATKGTAGLGALAAVPAGSANGTALGTMPAGAQGARLYLPTGASITFAVASAAPSSAPTTFTVSASTTGPNWDENLSGGQMIYVTAVTGSPLFRWY